MSLTLTLVFVASPLYAMALSLITHGLTHPIVSFTLSPSLVVSDYHTFSHSLSLTRYPSQCNLFSDYPPPLTPSLSQTRFVSPHSSPLPPTGCLCHTVIHSLYSFSRSRLLLIRYRSHSLIVSLTLLVTLRLSLTVSFPPTRHGIPLSLFRSHVSLLFHPPSFSLSPHALICFSLTHIAVKAPSYCLTLNSHSLLPPSPAHPLLVSLSRWLSHSLSRAPPHLMALFHCSVPPSPVTPCLSLSLAVSLTHMCAFSLVASLSFLFLFSPSHVMALSSAVSHSSSLSTDSFSLTHIHSLSRIHCFSFSLVVSLTLSLDVSLTVSLSL